MSLVRRYPLSAFFVLACALSWWPWILYSFGLVPTPIVGVGPFLAALVVLAVGTPCHATVPVLGTPSQPDPWGAVGFLAPAVRGNWGGLLD